MRRRSRTTRGLSLIEIVVVITIISMLMAAVAVYAIGQQKDAQRRTALMDTKNAATALELYRASRGTYPHPQDGFEPVVRARALKTAPIDPWGHPLKWTLVDGEPLVTSLGEDGNAGTEDDLTSAMADAR